MDSVKQQGVICQENKQELSLWRIWQSLFAVFLSIWVIPVQADQVAMVVGFDGDHWYPYVAGLSKKAPIKGTTWKKLDHIQDPVAITRQSKTGTYFVKSDRGDVVVYAESPNQKVVTVFEKNGTENNFTQLRAYEDGLMMVELIDGRSRETQLVNISNKQLRGDTQLPIHPEVVNKQLSSQFHPLPADNTLFYAHVTCRVNCDPVIQEIWKKNRVTGKAEQITLLNATSYLHSVDQNANYGYLSSNKSGYYHLARIDLGTGELQWLTDDKNTYSFPSISENNDLYFIQRSLSGSKLLKLKHADMQPLLNSNLEEVELPKQIKKLHYLEISNL